MYERTVHVTDRCNLACGFCPGRLAAAEPGDIEAVVRRVARKRPRRLYLSGGEPLLLRRLPDLVRAALDEGAGEVVVDSNGVLLADARRVRALRDAGVAAVRVFLPTGDPDRYAELTGLNDGLERVLVGLGNLRAAGLPVLTRLPDAGIDDEDRASARTFLAHYAPPAPLEATGPAADEVFVTENVDESGALDSVRVAVTYRCDQRCAMCDLAAVDGQPPLEGVERAIDDAAARAARGLVLTGGEPLRHPALDTLVRRAKDAGIGFVEIQTNAVALANEGRAEALASAGADRIYVSLHSADAAVSDALTRAPGTHARSVRGVDRALAAGIEVDLNCVLTTTTFAGLAALVRFVAERWGTHPRFGRLHVHTVRVDPDAPEPWRAHVPPLSTLAGPLREALALAHELGLPVTGPASAMGVPWCVLDGDPRLLGPLAGPGASRPYRHERALFVYAAACKGCVLRGRCPGVRRGYFSLHGETGLCRLSESDLPARD